MTTPLVRALSALTLALAIALGVTGCGGDDHNSADVAFATDMLPHHAQALEMVDMTSGRSLDPQVQQLAADIESAQAPEITTMTGWLEDWDEKVPTTSGAMGDTGSSMPGMMSADDMTSLQDATDADFQTRWLELMVRHHQGAVDMAETELADGEYPPALGLARSIVASQSEEIATMKAILAG